jgi:hypothetical protein
LQISTSPAAALDGIDAYTQIVARIPKKRRYFMATSLSYSIVVMATAQDSGINLSGIDAAQGARLPKPCLDACFILKLGIALFLKTGEA